VAAAQAEAPKETIRTAIFNPARATIRRFDRGPFSYRAGQPLSEFLLFFDRAPAAGGEPKFEIVSSVVRLRESKCFAASKGALTCLTCHDPHQIPRSEEAARHYNGVCQRCHASTLDRLVAVGGHTSAADCISCHMPKRRTDDVVHAVITDHWIQRRKPQDLLAAIPESHETEQTAYHGEVVPYYPKSLSGADGLYLAVAQVRHASNLEPGIQQLSSEIDRQKPANAEFYFTLGEAWQDKGKSDQHFRLAFGWCAPRWPFACAGCRRGRKTNAAVPGHSLGKRETNTLDLPENQLVKFLS
jgi:predicted CXXCH cytochrome family protein